MDDDQRKFIHDIWRSNTLGAACVGCPKRTEAASCRVSGGFYGSPITFVLDRPDDAGARSLRGFASTELGQMVQRACDYAAQELDIEFSWNYLYLTGAPHERTLKTVTEHCSRYLISRLTVLTDELDADAQHVLIPLGADAAAFFLGSKVKFDEVKSLAHPWPFGDREYTVVPSITPRTLFRSRGAVDVLAGDIATALRYALGIEEEALPEDDATKLTSGYVFPASDAELLELTETILNYTGKPGEGGVAPEDWPIAVDSETTGLKPWLEGHEPFAVSFAWNDGEATTIMLEHEQMEYSSSVARECVARILSSKKPKIFHNFKFDYKMLDLSAGFTTENVWFDTMLAAHFLRGNMTGFYGLGKLVPVYAPQYSGYKRMIKRSLRERVVRRIQSDLNQAAPDFEESYKISAFYPDIEYTPLIESLSDEALAEWSDKDVRKLFDKELLYVQAHAKLSGVLQRDEDETEATLKKTKSRARSKVRNLCKKYGVSTPDTVSDRDFDKELESDGGYENVPYDVLLTYAAIDASVTRQICKAQRAAAWKLGCEYAQRTRGKFERRAVLDDMMRVMRDECVRNSYALGQAEYLGIAIDAERSAMYREELSERVEATLCKMREITLDADFDPKKSADLEHVVRYVLSVPESKYQYTEKTSALSVTSSWIDARADDEDLDEHARAFFRELRAFKSAHKALTGFVEQLDTLSADDGRVHTHFNLNGTVTGRLSASRPSLQNFPLKMGRGDYPGHPGWNIKALFVPDGDIMWQLDIASAEIRVLAAYANDEGLTRAIIDGLDFHSFTASECFDYTYEEIVAKKDTDPEIKLMRTATKRVVFGLVYGAGPYTLAVQIFGELSEDLEQKQAQIQFAADTVDKIKARFPGIQAYTDETERYASQYGFARTYLGRYRRFDMRDVSAYAFSKAMRQAVNFRIQSTSAGLVNAQLCDVFEHRHEVPSLSLQLTVHDSMVGTCSVDDLPKLRGFFDRHIVEAIQTKFPWMTVPFAYDLEIGPTYGEKMPFEMYEAYAETQDSGAFIHGDKDFRDLARRCNLLPTT